MRIIRQSLIVLVTFCCISCKFFSYHEGNKTINQEEKPYKQDIVWTVKPSHGYDRLNVQNGRYYYIYEYETQGTFFYSKIDLENGERIWKTTEFDSDPMYCPLVTQMDGRKILIIADKKNITYLIDDENGELMAKVTFYEEYEDNNHKKHAMASANWIIYDKCVYWIKKTGLVKLDLSMVNYSKNPEELQYIPAKMIWEKTDNNQRIFNNIIENAGVIFFITFDNYENDGYCFIGAYDIKNEYLKWYKKTDRQQGFCTNNMLIIDDKLYIIEQGQGCYDIETGEEYWVKKLSLEEMKTQMDVTGGMYSRGISYWDGKFYYTNTAGWSAPELSGIPREYMKNILCIDTDGNYVWGDLPKNTGSLYTNPQVIKGQCLVAASDSLRVYDAKTGKLLGADNKATCFGFSQTLSYKDEFIYYSFNYEENCYYITAINVYDIKEEE